MGRSVVTAKGQVVIPALLRRKLGIRRGTTVQFREKDGRLELVPLTREYFDSQIGFLKTKGKLLRALMKEKEREREL